MQVCPNCGEENPDRFRLCGICGTKLAPEDVAAEVRRTVTVVFSDLKGSTTLGETLDTEALREVLNVYFNEMRAVLERHGGTVEKYIGDAIMAVFGLPKLHEDDAVRAVRAAFEMQRTLEEVNDTLERRWGVRLQNRTGVNTGEIVAGDVSAGQRLVTGDTVNTAARLEQAAPALEILIGESTYRLVRDAVEVEPVEPLELKGKAEPVPAYRLLSATLEEGVARRHDTPMVGRTEELRLLLEAVGRASETRRCQLVIVFGPAGVGKSRLLREFIHRAGEEVVSLRGRCLSYGDGITFWPLAEILREAAGIHDDDPLETARAKLAALAGEEGAEAAERVAAAIGLSDETYPVQETFWGARRLVELLARDRSTVVFIDDIHWAERTFLDLLRYLAETADVGLTIVCSARGELLEDHADWLSEDDNVSRIVLEALSRDESSTVIDNLLGSTELDDVARAKIVEAAEGNPLFVEQMLSMLIDEGVLARDDAGEWMLLSDLGTISIPPTISALLTARLDRLGATERATIERGSIIGQVFFRGAVERLSPEAARPHVGASLQGLVRKEFVRPHDAVFAGEESFRFSHILIKDAAYIGLLKRTRAELHEAFVDWLEEVATDRIAEYEEIRGYHLEQSYLIRVQLGPLDEHIAAIGQRGATYLSSAGHRALDRGDMPAASTLLQRAATLLPPGDPMRARLLISAGEALIELGEFASAATFLDAAAEIAAELGDEPLVTTARLVRLQLEYATKGGDEGQVIDEVERAIESLERVRDHQGLFRAWRLMTLARWAQCRYGAAEAATRRMIEHAQKAGDELMERRYLGSVAICELYGPTPAQEAIGRCHELLERARGDRKAEALIMTAMARLEAMRGEFDEARSLFGRSRATFDELGWKLDGALVSLDSGQAEMLADDPVAAEAQLRRDYETLDRMGERNYISTTAGFLAEALYRQGREDEADRLTRTSEEIAAPGDVLSQYLWRTVRAKILAHRGDLEEAERLVGEAVSLIGATDDPESNGNALMDLAVVLETAGKLAEAREAAGKAQASFELKGNVVSAARAQQRLTELAPVS